MILCLWSLPPLKKYIQKVSVSDKAGKDLQQAMVAVLSFVGSIYLFEKAKKWCCRKYVWGLLFIHKNFAYGVYPKRISLVLRYFFFGITITMELGRARASWAYSVHLNRVFEQYIPTLQQYYVHGYHTIL